MNTSRASPRALEWIRALRNRYLRSCEHHPTTGELDRHQRLERKNANYWHQRIESASPGPGDTDPP